MADELADAELLVALGRHGTVGGVEVGRRRSSAALRTPRIPARLADEVVEQLSVKRRTEGLLHTSEVFYGSVAPPPRTVHHFHLERFWKKISEVRMQRRRKPPRRKMWWKNLPQAPSSMCCSRRPPSGAAGKPPSPSEASGARPAPMYTVLRLVSTPAGKTCNRTPFCCLEVYTEPLRAWRRTTPQHVDEEEDHAGPVLYGVHPQQGRQFFDGGADPGIVVGFQGLRCRGRFRNSERGPEPSERCGRTDGRSDMRKGLQVSVLLRKMELPSGLHPLPSDSRQNVFCTNRPHFNFCNSSCRSKAPSRAGTTRPRYGLRPDVIAAIYIIAAVSLYVWLDGGYCFWPAARYGYQPTVAKDQNGVPRGPHKCPYIFFTQFVAYWGCQVCQKLSDAHTDYIESMKEPKGRCFFPHACAGITIGRQTFSYKGGGKNDDVQGRRQADPLRFIQG